MTDDEIKAIDQRLAAMSERVDAVIEKETRGKRMPVLDFKPRMASASGAGMPCADTTRTHPISRARYVPSEPDIDELRVDGSIEQIFADFERQFDEMAQAHRYRA